jgi:hypothetical protein
MGAGIGYTMAPPQGFQHMLQQDNTNFFSSIPDFFSYDPASTSESLIPPPSGSQHVFHTCNDPRFYQFLGEFFFVFVMLEMIKNSQGFKNFESI